MKNLKQQILLKMLEKHKTLSIKRHYFVRGKKQENGLFYDWNMKTKNASLLEVKAILDKTQAPFDMWSALAFADGKINKLIIDDSYNCLEVTY